MTNYLNIGIWNILKRDVLSRQTDVVSPDMLEIK